MVVLKITFIILVSLLLLGLLFGIYMLIKNENTCCQHIKICNAIFEYHRSTGLYMDADVTYSDMEEYDETFWRLWDWGCKRILPKEKFEIIKPYIKEKK